MAPYVELTAVQVGLASCLILVNGLISVLLRLGMERSLLVAAVRTVVQLLLVGSLLEWIFRVERWYVVLAMAALMTLVASITAVQRSKHRYPGIWLGATLSIFASSWVITAFGLFAVLRHFEPWYEPQYLMPLLGMILGNTLNGIALGLSGFTDLVSSRKSEVETFLALGATRWEAARGLVREAVRTGMIPIVNSMMVVGIVSMPGMMTGQLISGASPISAVKYQIMIMFLIASATALGTVGVVLYSYRRLFDSCHRLRGERLRKIDLK
jgi:putative ABC transport system permease protein